METKEKKQVVTAISKAANILVTVGVNPTVDELSALLGLTLLLGKLDKHATAVFSGAIPPAIAFLEPDKTFEDTVDGLRDFIIALNKDKADHLRYKLDGDVVKIFITPYKNTIIRDTDLQFSQGDFNVELVIALGVENKADLDIAVASHGRILHDATTISISSGNDKSELGEINWHASNASSLSEMLVSLARDLGDSLIDEHIATALMTGIVSNTDRFSNNLTTSDVMKTAASLMGLGANQQLIAAQLTEAEDLEPAPTHTPTPVLTPKQPVPIDDEGSADGTMLIAHDESGLSLPPVPAHEEAQLPVGPSLVDVERHKEEVLEDELSRVIPTPPKIEIDERTPLKDPSDIEDIVPQRRFIAKASAFDEMEEPAMGGTLNATTEQAEEDSRSAIEDDRNRVILSHDAPRAAMPQQPKPYKEVHALEPEPVLLPAPGPDIEDEPLPEPHYAEPEPERTAPQEQSEPTPPPQVSHSKPYVEEALATLGYPAGSHPTLAELDQKTSHQQPTLEVDDARNAVADALDSAFSSANNPDANIGSSPLGYDLHDPQAIAAPQPLDSPVISTPSPIVPVQTATAIDLPPLPPLPPLPGQEGGLPPLPPLPDMGELDAHSSERPAAIQATGPTENDWQSHTVEPPVAHDPNQFHIPGQN